MARSWSLIFVSSALACLTSGCKVELGANADAAVCPSIAIEPHAILDLGAGRLGHDGSFSVEVDADGQRERCVIELSGMAPAETDCPEGTKDCAASSPSTRTSTTCTLVGVSGIQDDGSVRYLDTAGTPATLNVTVRDADRILAHAVVTPDYSADECGFVRPTVALGPGQ